MGSKNDHFRLTSLNSLKPSFDPLALTPVVNVPQHNVLSTSHVVSPPVMYQPFQVPSKNKNSTLFMIGNPTYSIRRTQ